MCLVKSSSTKPSGWLDGNRATVIDYHPETDEGFSHVPRRPGIDHDLVREPGR